MSALQTTSLEAPVSEIKHHNYEGLGYLARI